jgi:hypothetical protein
MPLLDLEQHSGMQCKKRLAGPFENGKLVSFDIAFDERDFEIARQHVVKAFESRLDLLEGELHPRTGLADAREAGTRLAVDDRDLEPDHGRCVR